MIFSPEAILIAPFANRRGFWHPLKETRGAKGVPVAGGPVALCVESIICKCVTSVRQRSDRRQHSRRPRGLPF